MTNAVPLVAEEFALTMDDGAEILLRHHGGSNRVRLFISNGNGFAVDGYRVFWEPLIESFDLVLFDMRNHGRNKPCGGDGHNYRQMAKDLDTIFRQADRRLGHKPSVGVFHSMSARAAMKHASEREWVWDALVLFDPPSVPPRGHELYEAMRTFELRLMEWAVSRQEKFSSPEELHQIFVANRAQSRWTPQSREDMANAILRPDVQGNYVLSCRRELEASIYLAALTLELWPSAKSVGGPTKLIIPDPEGKGVPPTGAANRALAVEGGFEFETVPETGHLLQIESPQACREAMLSFLHKLALA